MFIVQATGVFYMAIVSNQVPSFQAKPDHTIMLNLMLAHSKGGAPWPYAINTGRVTL
jgi:hypothetical protein